MILGTYRRLTPEELKPLQNRYWIGFGANQGTKFNLEGIEWQLPGHPAPLIIVFQDRISETNDANLSTLAYTRIPYPHRILPNTRKRLANMLMHAEKEEFMEELAELALERNQ